MEIDNKSALLNYFMTRVKSSLKERGAYVGVASEYKAFFASTIGAVTTKSIGTLVQQKLFDKETDYRKQKEALESLLNIAFPEGKLVLIIDDIERCKADVAREYLFLLKEVATMKNCVSIFITDYDLLLALLESKEVCVRKSLNESYNKFLDKFFNYRVDLYNESQEDVFEHLDLLFENEDSSAKEFSRIIELSPGSWCKGIYGKINSRISDLENSVMDSSFLNNEKTEIERKLKDEEELCTLFLKNMKNLRNVVKFYNVFRDNMKKCYKNLFDALLDEELHSDKIVYIKTRKVGQIIAYLAFIEVYFPDQLEKIKESGAEYIDEPRYRNELLNDKDRKFLMNFANMAIYEESGVLTRASYIKEEMLRFINAFLEPNCDLNKLIKPFAEREDEWLDAIRKNEEKVIDANWNEMIAMILNMNLEDPNDKSVEVNERKKDLFKNLLQYAIEKVENKAWDFNKLFSVFKADKRGYAFSKGMGLLQVFEASLQKTNTAMILSNDSIDSTLDFARNYSYECMGTMCKLIKAIIPDKQNFEIDNCRERLLDSNRTLDENLNVFITGVIKCIPNLVIANCDWNAKYQIVAKRIKSIWEDAKLLKYDDVKASINHMMDSVNELYCLSQILKLIQNDNNEVSEVITENDFSQLDKIIDYFEKVFETSEVRLTSDKERLFMGFFNYLKEAVDISLNDAQFDRLNNLITHFSNASELDCISYRMILANKSIKDKAYFKKYHEKGREI